MNSVVTHLEALRILRLGAWIVFCVALLNLLSGCSRSSIPDSEPEFPFQHPAAKEVKGIFRTLDVSSAEDYRSLPRRDRYLWNISWFEAEVMNGGVDQYLYNSSGNHAIECLAALKVIGATRSHTLLEQACKLFPKGQPSSNQSIRQMQLREIVGNSKLSSDNYFTRSTTIRLPVCRLTLHKASDN
jgi:uncharacterized protein DUF4375